MTTTATTWIDTDITAESAPIGVQLWPTRDDAKYGDNFTLAKVEVVRDETSEANGWAGYVVWTYRNGNTRQFHLGEQVASKVLG